LVGLGVSVGFGVFVGLGVSVGFGVFVAFGVLLGNGEFSAAYESGAALADCATILLAIRAKQMADDANAAVMSWRDIFMVLQHDANTVACVTSFPLGFQSENITHDMNFMQRQYLKNFKNLKNLKNFSHHLLLLFVLCACGAAAQTPRGVPTAIVEASGSPEARIKAAYALFAPNTMPIGPLDAHMLSIKLGDGELGPSDYRYFVAVQYDPDSLQDWQAGKPPIDSPAYTTPQPTPAWWPDARRFQSLSFYSADGILQNGWIAIGENGWLYAFASTR
jgi:hypothetical protein